MIDMTHSVSLALDHLVCCYRFLHDACFSPEAFDAFNSGDAYIRAAKNGLARAMDQYVKDLQVGKSDDYIYQ